MKFASKPPEALERWRLCDVAALRKRIGLLVKAVGFGPKAPRRKERVVRIAKQDSNA